MTVDQLGLLILRKVKIVLGDQSSDDALLSLPIFRIYPYILRLDERGMYFTNLETFKQRGDSEADLNHRTEDDAFSRGTDCVVDFVKPGIVDPLHMVNLTGKQQPSKRHTHHLVGQFQRIGVKGTHDSNVFPCDDVLGQDSALYGRFQPVHYPAVVKAFDAF